MLMVRLFNVSWNYYLAVPEFRWEPISVPTSSL